MALSLLCSSKKSLSANQIHRMIGVTYKTAWFMAHRIRFATPNHWAEPKLRGTVEVDETFVGGKGDRTTQASRKTPVVAFVERKGLVRVKVVAAVTQKNLGAALSECVSQEAVVNTDEHPGYKNPLKHWKEHQTVNHSRREYQRKNQDGSKASTNTAESFFSLLKRAIIGAWHHISREHLSRCANEFAFRWNTRHDTDGKRLERFGRWIEGKRLTHRQVSQTLCVCEVYKPEGRFYPRPSDGDMKATVNIFSDGLCGGLLTVNQPNGKQDIVPIQLSAFRISAFLLQARD